MSSFLFLSAALLAGCGGGEEPGTGAVPDAIAALPTLEITSPARGAFLAPGEKLVVEGRAVAGAWPLATLEVDGEPVPLDADGHFRVELEPQPGVNLVGLRVEDTGGGRAVDGRAVHAVTERAPAEVVPGAVRLQLGGEVLDDDEPDLDDLAAILEAVVEDPAFADTIVGVPFDVDYAVIVPTSFSAGGAQVDLEPRDGALHLRLVLLDMAMDFDVEDIVGWSWLSTSGTAWADTVTLEADLVGGVAGGEAEVTLENVQGSLTGWALTVDWFPDSLEDDLAGWTQGLIEEQLAALAQEMTGQLVAELASAFEAEFEPIDGVVLGLALADLSFGEEGIRMVMDASARTSAPLPEGAGSTATEGAPPDFPLGDAPFEIAVDDDLVNQLAFAAWGSGILSGLTWSALEIAVLTGEDLPPPLGPVDRLVLDLGLPPTVAPGEGENGFTLSLGEFVLDITRHDGVEVTCSLNLAAGGDLSFGGQGEILVELDDRPSAVAVEAGMIAWPPELDPGDLASLFRLMAPTLVGSAGDFLPSLELPPIPLDSLADLDSLAGHALALEGEDIWMDDARWVRVSGTLAAAR